MVSVITLIFILLMASQLIACDRDGNISELLKNHFQLFPFITWNIFFESCARRKRIWVGEEGELRSKRERRRHGLEFPPQFIAIYRLLKLSRLESL